LKCEDDIQTEDMTINGPIHKVRSNCKFIHTDPFYLISDLLIV